ncbi:MAG: calcium-binding protein [Solirubrobacteraceae bacterium]
MHSVRLLTILFALALSAPAQAIDSVVSQLGGTVQYQGNNAEADVAVFTRNSATVLTLQDAGGIHKGSAPDCVDTSSTLVTCTVPGGITDLLAAGLSGNDTLTVSGSVALGTTLYGDDGNDILTGGLGNDTIDYGAGPGADTIDGGGGDDNIGFHDQGDVVRDTGTGGFDTLLFDLFPSGATIRVDNGVADDGATGSGLGEVKAGFEQFIGGGQPDHVFGSAAAETFRGMGGNDELVGGAGVDTFLGGPGDDTLVLTDGVTDGSTACGDGTDTASLDATGDTANADCETVTKASTDGGGGGGTTTTPPATTPPATTPPPGEVALPAGCPLSADMYLRDDYDVDRALEGDMNIQVAVPRGGVEIVAALTRGESGRTNEPLGPSSSVSSATAGVKTLRLRIDQPNAAALRGKSTPVVVSVFLITEGCPTILLSDYVQLAPKVDNQGVTTVPARSTTRASTYITIIRSSKCDPHNIFTYESCPQPQPVPDKCKKEVALTQVISYFGACIEQPDPKKRPGYFTSKVLVQMNGLYIQPTTAESQISWDSSKLEMAIEGKAKIFFKVKLPNGTMKDVVLWDGPAGTKFSLYSNELLTLRQAMTGDLLGFRFGADLALNFFKGGVTAVPTLTLPPQFGGVQATTRLKIPYSGEVDVNLIKLVVPELNAYGFKILNSQLTWEKAPDPTTKVITESWFGESTVQFPAMGGAAAGPEFGLSMLWRDGKFASGSVKANNLRQVFGNPLVALDQVSGELTLGDPLTVKLQGRVAFGPKLGPDTPPELANLEGTLTYTSPSAQGPGVWEANGNFELWQLPAGLGGAKASGKVTYTTDGQFTWTAYAQAALGAATIAGTVSGSVAGANWEVRGVVDLSLANVTGRGELHGNNKGIVGCVSTVAVGYGFAFEWAKRKVEPMQKCGLADWQKLLFDPAPRQAGSSAFTVPAGRSRMAVALTSDQPPALVTPSGAVLRPIYYVTEDRTAYFSVTKPEGGRWTVQQAAPLSNPRVAYGAPSIDVTAKLKMLSGGPRFKVDYASKLPAGLRLDFYEQLPGGGPRNLVKSGQDAKGSFSFRPIDAGTSSRKRRLIAVVTQGGVPTGQEEDAAAFVTGPAELPDAPGPVVDRLVDGKLVYFLTSRRKRDVVVRWGRAEGARGYEVAVRREDGRRRLVLTPKREIVLDDFAADEDVTIKVRGYNEDLEFGPSRSYEHKVKNDKVKKQTQKRIPDPGSVGYVEVATG